MPVRSLTIAIPALNEESTILEVVEKVKKNSLVSEIIVIDDGSTDGTSESLKGVKGIKLLRNEVNRGKGFSIRRALEAATGEYFLVQDADLELSPDSYQSLFDKMDETNADMVVATRDMENVNATIFTWLGMWMSTLEIMLFFGKKIADPLTCYKLIKTEDYRALGVKSDRFEVDIETICRALKNRLKVVEQVVPYSPRSYQQGKKIKWTDGVKILSVIARVRFGII